MYPLWYHYPLWYSVWKPAWIPTTFGNKLSFLEMLIDLQWDEIKDLQQSRSTSSYSHEYGLINRLDNDTTWLLFFAKTPEVYLSYKKKQSQGQVEKIYYADLYGDFFQSNELREDSLIVDIPLFHHASDATKMTIHPYQWRWREHQVTTKITPLYYDSLHKSTTCSISITKGIRHQIRIHTSSIGHPIIGEKIYIPQNLSIKEHIISENLHLRSMWIII